ncbi:MAG TPA: TCR/Tet family MFS transporter [Candidatus Didemnitutus sp.]|nr:TCR/Tet family MFS transporter [Candidatus Didemnitutus sp.]
MSAPRKPAVGFIFFTLVLAIVGFGLLIPVLPQLIVQLSGNSVSEGSGIYGWMVSVYAAMQFIASPILGSLSDRFGRRPIILIATAGSAIDYLIMANAPNLSWFFVARMISGGTAGVLSTANAYIADVTPPEKRAQSFGLLGAAFGLGFVIGPAVGGFLGKFDLHLPFLVAAGCSGANWLYGFFVLPESLKPENRRPFSWARANPIGALLALRRLPAVLGLAWSYFLLSVAQTMLQSTWALYTGYRYHWDTSQVGFLLMYVGIVTGAVQATLVKKIVPKLGETRAVILGFTIMMLAQVGYGLASQGWMIYAMVLIGALAGISGPAMQAYITRHVPSNEQGSVQGVYSGLASLAGMPGPILASHTFGWAIAPERSVPIPGLSFFEAALVVLIALILTQRTFRQDAKHPIATPPPATAV